MDLCDFEGYGQFGELCFDFLKLIVLRGGWEDGMSIASLQSKHLDRSLTQTHNMQIDCFEN